jgi:hypothetical protein
VSKFNRVFLLIVLAIASSLLSVFIERTGPESVPYGNLCGPSSIQPCLEPVLKGGFPVAFLFDRPGVSVEHQLHFGEDILRINSLTLNTALHFVAVMLLAYTVTLLRKGISR